VITPLGRFESAVKAAIAHGLSPSHGHARAKRQIDGWRFEDEPPRFRRKWAIAVTTPGGEFPTVSAAAKHHDICCATVEARIRRGEEGWHYSDPVASGQTRGGGQAPQQAQESRAP